MPTTRSKMFDVSRRSPIRDTIEEENPGALFIGDPEEFTYDPAILGVGNQHGRMACVVYSYQKIVECCMELFQETEDLDEEELYSHAVEWVDFNIVCAYMGPGTPIIVHEPERE